MSTPCPSCGAQVPDGGACPRCAPAGGKWVILAGNERFELDRAGVRAAVQRGRLMGTDRVIEGGRETLLAAHPAFRTWFVAGHPDAIRQRPWARWVLAALVVVATGGAAGYLLQDHEIPDPHAMKTALEEATRPPPPPPLAPAVLEPIRARVGAVHRAAPMLTEAETRRLAGETDLAIAAAERAVVADPERVDALGLLLALYAETGRYPETWGPLSDALAARRPSDPATRRAASALALARGDLPTAEAEAQTCLRDNPGSLPCREALATAREAMVGDAAGAAPVLAELEALARDWPDNQRVRRRSALLAARVEAPGAEALLDGLLATAPDDRSLVEARAKLAAQDGDLRAVEAYVKALDPASDPLLLDLARLQAAAGKNTPALATIGRRAGPPDLATRRLRARLLLALGKTKEAAAAADEIAAEDTHSPASVQLRVAIALAQGNTERAVAAGAALDAERAPALDAARAWVAVGAADLARGRPQDAALSFDRAVALDGSDPETWLWRLAAAVEIGTAAPVTAAVQGAISAVDGRAEHRPLHDGPSVMLPPAARVRSAIADLYEHDPALASQQQVATSVAAWLAGDLSAAREAVGPAAEAGDPYALALRARLSTDPNARIADLQAALSRRPKESAWRLALAEAFADAGRLDEASTALTEARSGPVAELSARRLAARLADARGDRAAADVERRAILALEPGDTDTRRALRR